MSQKKSSSSSKTSIKKINLKEKKTDAIVKTQVGFDDFWGIAIPIHKKLDKYLRQIKDIAERYDEVVQGMENLLYESLSKKIKRTEIVTKKEQYPLPIIVESLRAWQEIPENKFSAKMIQNIKAGRFDLLNDKEMALFEMHILINKWVTNATMIKTKKGKIEENPEYEKQRKSYALEHRYQGKEGIEIKFKEIEHPTERD